MRDSFVALRSLFHIAKSLPKRFSLTLAAVAFIYFPLATMFSARLDEYVSQPLKTWLSAWGVPSTRVFPLQQAVSTAATFTLLTLLMCLTLLIFFGIVGVIQKQLWPKPAFERLRIHGPVRRAATTARGRKGRNPLDGYKKIGIILSGGGAKGAYQAGALKAIHEFVVKHGARNRVKMIAGTSIGAWNALFWLADLIDSPDDGPGLLEQWWSQICVPGVIRPAFYFPFYRNFLLSDQPWRDTFKKIFGDSNKDARARLCRHIDHPNRGMHFYFTKSNVCKGRLDYSTNRKDLTHSKKDGDRATSVEDLQGLLDAVFCSMGIPPLFNYMEDSHGVYEDGGVVNNLPIRFGTEIEECNLLFVLPLNATFAVPKPGRRSLSKRLMRVMDIRQGVLERNALKMVKLYNQLASLREEVKIRDSTQGQGNGDTPASGASVSSPAHHALKRENRHVRVFCICPKPKEPIINTMDFWNVDGARRAFKMMYAATKEQLESNFDKLVNTKSGGVCMAQVDEDGHVEFTNKF